MSDLLDHDVGAAEVIGDHPREERTTRAPTPSSMVDDLNIVEFLDRLSERCGELLGCAEAGLLLTDAAGVLRVMASSGERSDSLDLPQTQNEEGPCFDCFQRGEPVSSADLRSELGRWPTFGPAAVQRGFSSVQALPMRVRGNTIGALNLFCSKPGGIEAGDLPLGQGMADIAAVALLQERSVRESRTVVDQLQRALLSRVLIEQAKGVVAEHLIDGRLQPGVLDAPLVPDHG